MSSDPDRRKSAVKGIVIAGTQSGAGKTTLSLALLAALKRRGHRVVSFKVGPDFIDPGHHKRITGTSCRNLDGWMLSRSCNRAIFSRHTADADLAVVEGVMGLFDGYDGKTEAGSTAQMAKWLNLPVLLTVNARSMARSAAALVYGFENFDPDLRFGGVIFNHLGSSRHLNYLKEALEGHVQMPCLGGLPANADIAIPERHLGLVTREDHPLSPEGITRLADFLEASVDMDALLAVFSEVKMPPANVIPQPAPPSHPVRIGVARDPAFCFYYPDNLEALEAAGAKLVFFSPVSDTRLPDALAGMYFGGGYPELYAGKLAANTGLRAEVRAASLSGMPIYAECGGLMYLCRELTDLDGRVHPMSGCFPMETRMLHRLRTLGYREITLNTDTLLGRAGDTIRGHEFHYSEIATPADLPCVYAVASRHGETRTAEGFQLRQTLGSYIHLHFGSRPEAADAFVQACRNYRTS